MIFFQWWRREFTKFATLFLVGIIVLYKKLISPFLPGACRFLPTCSEYGIDALKTHGPLKGSLLTVKRIARCHPVKALGGQDGFDPVPAKPEDETSK